MNFAPMLLMILGLQRKNLFKLDDNNFSIPTAGNSAVNNHVVSPIGKIVGSKNETPADIDIQSPWFIG